MRNEKQQGYVQRAVNQPTKGKRFAMNVGCDATENTENGMYGNQQGSAVTANAQRYRGGRCVRSIMSETWKY